MGDTLMMPGAYCRDAFGEYWRSQEVNPPGVALSISLT
jgi:hypothetical protein